jgi:hypothetical protein
MNNIINNWSYDKPTEPGDYFVCRGDIETEDNITFEKFKLFNGQLEDSMDFPSADYGSSYKFARLVYSPTEIKEIEDA